MGIFGFLFGLGCLVVIAGAVAILGSLVFGRKHCKHRQQNRPQQPPSLTPLEIQERNSPQSTIAAPPIPTVPRRKVVAKTVPGSRMKVR